MQIPTRKPKLPPNVRNWILIVSGLLCTAAAYRMYLVPNRIAAGGFTGIGQILNSLTGVPVGIVSAALNVPLFLLSMRAMGLRFGLRSFIAMLALSVLIDWLPLKAVTDDMMLSCVFGGVIAGLGFGLIIRGNATTGGTDMLATIINKHVPVIKVGICILLTDGLVVIASAFVFDQIAAMYALICVVIMNLVVDFVLDGPNSANCYLIISDKSDEIAEKIMREMERGVTSLKGKGMYSNKEKDVLVCVINRFESMRLRKLISSVDPAAFIIVEKTHEVLGEGFGTK